MDGFPLCVVCHLVDKKSVHECKLGLFIISGMSVCENHVDIHNEVLWNHIPTLIRGSLIP